MMNRRFLHGRYIRLFLISKECITFLATISGMILSTHPRYVIVKLFLINRSYYVNQIALPARRNPAQLYLQSLPD